MKDFDLWNEYKKEVEKKDSYHSYPKKGEVWLAVLGFNIGREQDGGEVQYSRPVLVVKVVSRDLFVVLCLTKKVKPELSYYYVYKDPFDREVSIIFSQIRSLSVKRFLRKIYTVSPEDFVKMSNSLKEFLFQ